MSEVVSASDMPVADNRAKLPIDAIDDETLVVKKAGGAGSPLVKGTDYATYYSGGLLYIELLAGGEAYAVEEVNVEYKAVSLSSVTPTLVATGLQNIEKCMSSAGGVIPDLIVAPGFSCDPAVAAVMAAKTAINGVFGAKALVDISADAAGGAASYMAAIVQKNANFFIDRNQIACWPMLRYGGRIFHMSTQLAGLMAAVDAENGGIPYESPSNKTLMADGLALGGGAGLSLTHEQANTLNANGIVTALNFMGAWSAWGNYTACYPGNGDVKDIFVPVSRMFDWVGNTVVRTFWNKLDKAMNSRLRDNIVDTCNIWLNGIVGAGFLLGARVEVRDVDNPFHDVLAGIIRVRIFITPPSPAQEIAFILEYDTGYLAAALAA